MQLILPDFQVHQETFGKSGCRRIVPGQYLAVDPKGRAVMIGRSSSLLHTMYAVLITYNILYMYLGSVHV